MEINAIIIQSRSDPSDIANDKFDAIGIQGKPLETMIVSLFSINYFIILPTIIHLLGFYAFTLKLNNMF